jgi:D-3-phosphoglycerate dehydrogenase
LWRNYITLGAVPHATYLSLWISCRSWFDSLARDSYSDVLMKIIVADKISDRGVECLREAGWDIVLPSKGEIAAALSDADALIVRSATRVTCELLELAPHLRVIGRAGTGVDNIDVDAATRRGVLVMNTPGGNAVSVAEHTIALLLALARSIPQFTASIREGRWEKGGSGSIPGGIEVRGKTLGLAGLGRVGSEVARRAHALEMTVLAFDPYINAKVARDVGAELVSFEELLRRSDFVSLHMALSPATQSLFNTSAFAQMKRGARLINTARGELVDEGALATALNSGQLAGAALDVFAQEPPKNSPLTGLPNVIATPHVAASTPEAQEEVGTLIAQQVRDFLAEGVMRNAVNLPTLSAEQYRRVRPYLDLAERLGSFAAQMAPDRIGRVRICYAGELAEMPTHFLRSAVLAGVLNCVLEDKVNLVSAGSVAAARGLTVEECTRSSEQGFPNTLEVCVAGANRAAGDERTAEGTVLYGSLLRILSLDGIPFEAPLAGTLLFTRNRDVPGVIGQMGTVLGGRGINIATFALGRRSEYQPGTPGEALAVVRLDGEVPADITQAIRGISAVLEARLIRLPNES